MGVWHNVAIDNQKNSILSGVMPTPNGSTQVTKINKKGGELGLLSFPRPSSFLYPLSDEQNIHIAIDGRIHNKKALYHKFNFDENTNIGSVVISLYMKYGPDGIYDLEGSFSLILYDNQKQLTLLYRSFLTGYPLYYVAKNNLLSVSTNSVDLIHRSDVSDRLDMDQMSTWYSLEISLWTDTVFLDLSEVQHGEMVTISPMGIKSKKRALEDVLISSRYGSEIEMIETYSHLVENAIEKIIVPNTQYGIMLSSGMDSSTLAVFASQQLKKQGSKLKAYSWSLPSYQKVDETKKIRALCSALEIDLDLFDAEKFAPFSELDNLIRHTELPFTNLYSSMISHLYHNASNDGVNVLLNGNYGDNLFPLSHNLFVDMLRDRRFELFLPTMKLILSQTGYLDAIKKSPAIRGFIKHFLPVYNSKKSISQLPEWLSSEAKESRIIAWKNKKPKIAKGYEIFSYALAKHSTSLGMGRYSTGKFGIERIEPYTDVELLNYTLRLPAYMVYRDGQLKYVAREAMRGLLSESIRTQPRVGVLNQFAYDGFIKNKENVRERLFDEREPWKVYVSEKWMEKKFKKNAEILDKDLLVIWMSLNIGPWQKAIKPGGSLYEGTFMQNRMNQ